MLFVVLGSPANNRGSSPSARRQPPDYFTRLQAERSMPKYLFVYRGPKDQPAAPPSPEQMQAALKQWGDWVAKFAASGNILDGGDGLLPTGKVVRSSGVISDGPFAESKEVLGGYSVISADNYNHAVKIASECPAVLHNGSVEIRELAGYN